MFFADAICQQYFIPILRKFQHFISQIQSFMSFSMWNNLKRFSTSSRLRITLKFRNKLSQNPQYDIFPMAGWWRAGRKFLSSFELIRTILESMHCELSMKMLIKIKFLSFQVASHIFFIGVLDLWLKFLFKFTSFTISKRAVEMTFESHR